MSAALLRRTTVLILGAGVMQLPAIRIARERGWRVVVADGNDRAIGKDESDLFLHVDLKDKELMEDAARKVASDGGLDGVFTAGTDFSATVAWVAERLGLPGIPYAAALRATDKALMRAAFRDAGVPSPGFFVTDRAEDATLHRYAEGLRLPLVVKPVDNMGARGIMRVDTVEELEPAVASALAFSRSRRAIVEEHVAGPEFSLDAIVDRGVITVTGVADRIIRFPPYFVETGHTMPTRFESAAVDRICSVFEAGIRAIGIDCGAAKGDIKLSSRGPVVGEIAARLSGGYMSGWTFPYSSGVEPIGAALNVAVGLPAGDLTPRWNAVSAERAFFSIPGVVERVSGIERARRAPFVKDCFVRAARGDRVVFPRNNVEKCGNVLTLAFDRGDAVAAAEEACRGILVHLRPSLPETAAFLYRRAEEWVVDAFPLGETDEGLVVARALAVMPPFVAGGREPPPTVWVLPLAGITELPALDWQGASVHETLAAVAEHSGVGFLGGTGAPDSFEGVALGRLFWVAFLRGGAQGGLWAVESARAELAAAAERGEHEVRAVLSSLARAWGLSA